MSQVIELIEQYHEMARYSTRSCAAIEEAARTCYKSEHKKGVGSDRIMVSRLIARNHGAMLEFDDVTVKIVTNRGVTHELVRHRLCSFAQESTRYVRYGKEPMMIIKPVWWNQSDDYQKRVFLLSCEQAAIAYKDLLDSGWTPQQAREVLPNALKTEIVMKANIREWRHVFNLRTAKAAHPQMRSLMQGILIDFKNRIPVVFDDIEG